MCTTEKKPQETGISALQEELELRYGPGLAQQIADQIRQIEDPAYVPDFMAVKALSEALEIFRAEAKGTVLRLKAGKAVKRAGVIDLDEKRLERDLNRLFACYREAQRGFYILFDRAMKACQCPENRSYKRYSLPTEMKQAA